MGNQPARRPDGVLVSPARNRARMRCAASAIVLTLALAGQAHAQSSASDFTTATRYDSGRRGTGTIAPDPDGSGGLHYLAVRNTYDSAGRLTKVEKGELSSWQSESVAPASWSGFSIQETMDTSYDAMSRKVLEVRSSGSTAYTATQYSYDALGRLECTAVRMNPSIYGSLPSSACTLGTAGSHGDDRITRNVYDAAGQVLKVQKAYATSLQQDYAIYTYSANGKRTSVTDANGNKASMTFDGHDRQAKWNFPSPTSAGTVSTTDYEQYGYDAAGNRTSMRKRDGRSFTFGYDALNRVTSKIVPDACLTGSPPPYACTNVASSATRDVYYGYDLRGLQTAARFDSASGADAVTSVYDGFGRLTSSTTAMGGVSRTLSYQYDADGNRTRMSWPDSNFVNQAYDGLDRPYYADLNTAVPYYYTYYDAAGRIQQQLRQAGGGWNNNVAFGYDGISRPTSIATDLTGTSYDVTATFAYNPASQVVTRGRSNDAYAFSGYVSVSRNYTANGLNQYASVGGNSYGYDSNGNLTSDGTLAFTYDAENRLVATSAGANLVYDPLGRLYQVTGSATDTRFLYDGDQLTAEYDASGNLLRRYVHGNGEDDPMVWYEGSGVSSPRNLYADHQGSIVAITDASGNVTRVNAYDEYGIPNSGNSVSVAGRFQYTGQAWIPELGMYHYKARVYSPTLGRFLQTDPIGYMDQTNLYAYVGNDPINHNDPTGLECSVAGKVLTCHFRVVVPQGQKDLTAKQRSDAQRFANNYTRTVAKFSQSNASTTVGRTLNIPASSFSISAKSVGESLYKREVYIRPGQSRGNAGMDTGGHPYMRVFSNVYQSLLSATNRQQQEAIAHDGIHSTPEERFNNPLSLNGGVEPYRSGHQAPYTKAARDLLDED